MLRRQRTPFWDYLDGVGVPSTFYDLPSNYPPSPSRCGHHRCICGMGTPDVLGSYGTYQHFAEGSPAEPVVEGGGRRFKLTFENDTARVRLLGPDNSLLKQPEPTGIDLAVHRDREGNAAVLQVAGKRIVRKPGQWSRWTRLEFALPTPSFLPTKTIWLVERPNFAVLHVGYADVVARPSEAIARLNDFLGGRLSVEAACAAVDPSLYRNRKAAAEPAAG